MITIPRLTAAALVVATVALAACDVAVECPTIGQTGIILDVRDPHGNSASAGAMVILESARGVDTTGPYLPELFHGTTYSPVPRLVSQSGLYKVTVSKPFWTTESRLVNVPGHGRCDDLDTRFVTITIAKVPDAPAVRSVAIAPRHVQSAFCRGRSFTLESYVEAEAGLSQAVEWGSDDAGIISVDETGRFTLHSPGTTRVLARSVADPTVVGYVPATIIPDDAGACP